jgi:hypothetical protein
MHPRRWLLILAAVVVAVQVAAYARVVVWMASTGRVRDFAQFHSDARAAILEHRTPYERELRGTPANAVGPVNLNPPHFLLLVAPLAVLDLRPAYVVWMGLSVISAAAALAVILREVGLRATSLAGASVIGGVLASAPTGVLLIAAQVSWLLWWPFCWSWAAARRGRWTGAAVVLGILASLKPFLLVSVPLLLATRRWRAAGVTLAAAASSYAVGLAVFGWQAFHLWLVGLGSITWSKSVLNASLFGALERAFTDRPAPAWNLASIANIPALVYPLWILASAVILSASTRTVLRAPSSAGRVDLLYALTVIVALLVSPVGWIYYFCLFVGPVLALAVTDRWWRTFRRRRLLLACFSPSLLAAPSLLAVGQPNGLLSVTLGSLYFWSLLALWICVVLPVGRIRKSQAPSATLPSPRNRDKRRRTAF